MIASAIAWPAMADDAQAGVPAQVWTTWAIDDVAVEGNDQQDVLDQVADHAGIDDPADIAVVVVLTVDDGSAVRSADFEVFHIPAGATVNELTAEVSGFDTSICVPRPEVIEAPPSSADNGVETYFLTIDLDCAPEREVSAVRNWTVNVPADLQESAVSVEALVQDATGLGDELQGGFAFDLKGLAQNGTETTSESGEWLELWAGTEVDEVRDLLDIDALVDGIDRCTVTGPRIVEVSDAAADDDRTVQWLFWYDLDCTTTIEIWTGWSIDGAPITAPDDVARAEVAAAAGIDPDDIHLTFEIEYQPVLPGQPDGVGNAGDPRTVTTTDTVVTIPYDAELISIDATTIAGFGDSICTPSLVPLLSPFVNVTHTAPDPNSANSYTLDIALDCEPDREVAAFRIWTLDLDQELIGDGPGRPADIPTIDDTAAELLIGAEANQLAKALLTLELLDVFSVEEQVGIQSGDRIEVRADTEVLGVRDSVDEVVAASSRCAVSNDIDRVDGGEPGVSSGDGVAPDLAFLVWWDLTCAPYGRVAVDWLLDGEPASPEDVAAAAGVPPAELTVVATVGYTPIDEMSQEGQPVHLGEIAPDTTFDLPLRARVDAITLAVGGLLSVCTVTSPLTSTRPSATADEYGEATYLVRVEVNCDGPVEGDVPEVSDVSVAPSPTPIGATVTLTATATAAPGAETSSAVFTVEDADGRVVANGAMRSVEDEFGAKTEELVAELDPDDFTLGIGVYEVCVTATDTIERTSEAACTMLVVYDPSAGFVTGGGWFDSPEGALSLDETATGRASFGFVARYQRNGTVPVGNTQFQFHAGDLNFHSTSYDWLVVNQGGSNAQFKGEGRLNGVGGFGFMIWATDGGRDGVDTFRIRITGPDGGLVYDNDGHALGAGSIVVHAPRGNAR